MVPRRRRQQLSTARGTVMVLFALVVVVILGTIGLVIEMGNVRVTRERMQSAADATALETLRERDLDADFDPDTPDDPAERDLGRRERNRRLASWTFANEIADTYEESVQGAGPYIDMSSSSPNPGLVDNSLILNEVGHSVPTLRTNYDGQGNALNQRNGDIVSGHFKGHKLDGNGELPLGYPIGNEDGNPIYREASDYQRLDFDAAEPADAPAGDSVLVRLRRTVPNGQPSGPWNDVEEHVSSSGWTLPLVFGLGAPFQATDPAQGYSIRHHGLPLRATAVAQAKPAVRIGAPAPELGPEWVVGAGPMVMRWAEWMSDATFKQVNGTGPYSAVLRIRPPSYDIVSVDHDSNVSGYLYPKQPSQVGDRVNPAELVPNIDEMGNDFNLTSDYWEVSECFIPLYRHPTLESARHVCGFARVQIEEIDFDPSFPHHLAGDRYMRMTKLPNTMSPGQPWVAPRNASATFDGRQLSVVYVNTTHDWQDILGPLIVADAPNVAANYVFESRVYAPAHVR